MYICVYIYEYINIYMKYKHMNPPTPNSKPQNLSSQTMDQVGPRANPHSAARRPGDMVKP